ncbi:MAG TPA: hypothetical protein VK154_00800 [Chitinophagales bacterium]|nr:hypothetical protein [Chitinophagales bacterium]
MSLHSKKLEIIESILKVEEESVLYEVKSALKKAAKRSKDDELSEDELIELLNISAKDHKNGNSISQADLRKQVKAWKKK